ncbi:hypothetical protein F383_22408 [Gossypium arboreum]|uniref:Uncharacterized protein n=1 Tax=Gossypium arboreum TaxID=29729 RepID=A0A0B0NVB4_GOSAR|nr:hypothetical protein F383_22408 [Gossypium arboreum]
MRSQGGGRLPQTHTASIRLHGQKSELWDPPLL